jgi:integrase
LRHVSLAEARVAASAARQHLRAGRDPIAERELARQSAGGVPTFGEMADHLIEGIEHGFRNAKHRYQWRQTLTQYAKPLRPKPVDAITTEDVLECLKPLWQTKAETAARLRGRIERVLDAAKAKGYRTGENPARWRGHLDSLLPKRQRLTRGHHAAMPFDEVRNFIARLREIDGIGAKALEFLILTAARTGEVIGARWGEIDLSEKVWTVPADRIKAGREHRVPLSQRAVDIVHSMAGVRTGDFVFPGFRNDRSLSNMAMRMTARRAGGNLLLNTVKITENNREPSPYQTSNYQNKHLSKQTLIKISTYQNKPPSPYQTSVLIKQVPNQLSTYKTGADQAITYQTSPYQTSLFKRTLIKRVVQLVSRHYERAPSYSRAIAASVNWGPLFGQSLSSRHPEVTLAV